MIFSELLTIFTITGNSITFYNPLIHSKLHFTDQEKQQSGLCDAGGGHVAPRGASPPKGEDLGGGKVNGDRFKSPRKHEKRLPCGSLDEVAPAGFEPATHGL